MLCPNAMVRYKVLKVTTLHCFRFTCSYNEAYSLLTFGIQQLNSSIESNATINGSLNNVSHASFTILYKRDSNVSFIVIVIVIIVIIVKDIPVRNMTVTSQASQ